MPETSVNIALINHLQKERAAILAGDFREIDALFPLKEEFFRALAHQKLKTSELIEIQSVLAKNQRLLRSSIDGVKSAKARLTALREVRQGLRVYDQSGQFSAVSSAQNEINKRT
jgi:hypothetical protein